MKQDSWLYIGTNPWGNTHPQHPRLHLYSSCLWIYTVSLMFKQANTHTYTYRHTHSVAKQRRKDGCWEHLNKKAFLERSTWAGKQRGEVPWRRTGGIWGSPVAWWTHLWKCFTHARSNFTHTHTHLTNLQGPLRLSKNSNFLVFADIRTVGMLCNV